GGGAPTVGMVGEGDQGGHVAVGGQPDVAALAAVAAVGTAPVDVGLPAERDRAGAAVAAPQVDHRLVGEIRHRWLGLPGRGRALLPWQDVDEAAAAAGAELHLAVGGGEQRVVAAPADVVAGVELGAPLTDDDRAGAHGGAVEDLHPEPLGGRVTPVAGRGRTLLLRHGAVLLTPRPGGLGVSPNMN